MTLENDAWDLHISDVTCADCCIGKARIKESDTLLILVGVILMILGSFDLLELDGIDRVVGDWQVVVLPSPLVNHVERISGANPVFDCIVFFCHLNFAHNMFVSDELVVRYPMDRQGVKFRGKRPNIKNSPIFQHTAL